MGSPSSAHCSTNTEHSAALIAALYLEDFHWDNRCQEWSFGSETCIFPPRYFIQTNSANYMQLSAFLFSKGEFVRVNFAPAVAVLSVRRTLTMLMTQFNGENCTASLSCNVPIPWQWKITARNMKCQDKPLNEMVCPFKLRERTEPRQSVSLPSILCFVRSDDWQQVVGL